MMKKSRNRRRRTAKLTAKDIVMCKFFALEGRQMNAHKVEIKFQRKYNTIQWVLLFSSMMRHTSRLLSDGMIIAIMLFHMELRRLSHTI